MNEPATMRGRALKLRGERYEELFKALAEARACYSTQGIEGAMTSGRIKRVFDAYDGLMAERRQ